MKTLNPFGTVTLTDVTNSYELRIDFDTEKNNRSSGLMSYFSSAPKKLESGATETRRDLLRITIDKVAEDNEDERETVAQAKGSYLESITYDGDSEPIWSINSQIPRMKLVPVDPKDILPSDSSLRPDSKFLLEENFDEAEAAKHILEELQRNDKKLRAEREKAR